MFFMDNYNKIKQLLLLVQLFIVITYCAGTQEFEEEPQNITIQRGESVTFPCKVKNLRGTIQWTMNGFGLGTDRDLVAFQRYMMIGSDETGNFSLHITTALLADEAEYQCQVGSVDGEAPLRSKVAKLTVLYPPKDDLDQVFMEPSSPLQAIAGATIRVTCRGGLTKPVSNITWYKGENKIESGVQTSVESLSNSMLKSVTSWVDLIPDNSFHKENISCHISHPALETSIVRSLIMLVQYPPSVTVAKHFIKATEGDTVKFTCTADGNPQNFRYRWEVNSIAVGDHEPELILRKITRKDNQAEVMCIVSNNVGNGRGTETLDVEYEPIFTKEPEDVDADEGETVSIECLVDSNPSSEIVWSHDNSNKVIGHGASWSITVNKDTEGMYRCRVAAPGYPEISRSMMVFSRGPPEVFPNQVMFGLEDTRVEIECVIQSIPRPSEVIWSKDGVIIDTKTLKYEAQEVSTRVGIRKRLIIRNAVQSDFGFYNCTAKNDFGIDSQLVELRKQRTLPLVTTLVAIVGAIMFIVIVSVVVLLFKRQGKRYKDPCIEKQSVRSNDHSSTQDSVLKGESRTGSDLSHCDDDSPEDWETNDSSSLSITNFNRRPKETYRFSGDFSEPIFPPENTPTSGGGGYIPYVDYNRDYQPPPPPALSPNFNRNSIYASQPLNNVDPRFSAAYGNPYLRVPPNARAANYASGGSFDNLNNPSPLSGSQNNNLNNINLSSKNVIYNPIGQHRNNLRNNNSNSQYILLPQSENQTVQGTQI